MGETVSYSVLFH